MGNGVNSIALHIAALAHKGEEVLITVLDVGLQEYFGFLRHGQAKATKVREARCANPVGVNADRAQGFFKCGDQAKNTDRSCNGGGHSPYLVSGCRNPVPARSCHRTHRDHNRFAHGLQLVDLLANDLGGKSTAAAAVYAQHNRFHMIIISRCYQLVGDGVATDGAGGLFAIKDGAAGGDNGNGVFGGADRADVRHIVFKFNDVKVAFAVFTVG